MTEKQYENYIKLIGEKLEDEKKEIARRKAKEFLNELGFSIEKDEMVFRCNELYISNFLIDFISGTEFTRIMNEAKKDLIS